MKHRVTFEPKDFEGCGQVIVRDNFGEGDMSQALSMAYKIGYIPGESKESRIVMISLADGAVCKKSNLEKLCVFLNTDEFGYRPVTTQELSNMMISQGNRFTQED